MKGDFSRLRFNPAKQYTAVLQQQGRVALDSDANEQSSIYEYLRDTTNYDVIGPVGGPVGSAGFGLKVEAGQIYIESGRYYVNGLMVENDRRRRYDDQPYLNHQHLTSLELLFEVFKGKGQVTAQFILEVWQRLVTDLDDDCLREPALGQADTTARLQTVWRVVGFLNDSRLDVQKGLDTGLDAAKLYETPTDTDLPYPITYEPTPITNQPDPVTLQPNPITDQPAPIQRGCGNALRNPTASLSSCCQSLYQLKTPKRTGTMGADTSPSSDCGCQPIAPAGYQGLENQLYRVEIHHSGTLDTATFKWSRENGSVVTKITYVNGATITVSSLGPDANLGFQAGQWVELSDDNNLFGMVPNKPGDLYQILSVQQSTMQVTMTTPVTGIDKYRHARMRRWDQASATSTADGIPLSATPIQLENGIEVTFSKGDYISGDYWTIPARTADGKIDWPPCGGDNRFFQPAGYTPIFVAPIACIHQRFDGNQETGAELERLEYESLNDNFSKYQRFFEIDDCRLLFPPLTALCGASESEAMHVQSISWTNDDVMTVDTLMTNGLSITFDQPPTCPWSGGNFCVTIEAPGDPLGGTTNSKLLASLAKLGLAMSGPNALFRSPIVLDTFSSITVSGNTVTWLTPTTSVVPGSGSQGFPAAFLPFILLNVFAGIDSPSAWARVRIKLIGGAVYADGDNGNLYLDGQSFGSTETRSADGAQRIDLAQPSGDGATASDFESWFYLAPTQYISNVVIQGVEEGKEKTVSAVKVLVDNNNITGLQVGETQSIPVTNLQALITLSYPPITQITVSLTLVGPETGSVVSIAESVTIAAGQLTKTTPINILTNPGPGTQDYTLVATTPVALLGNFPFSPAPKLAITGSPIPTQ